MTTRRGEVRVATSAHALRATARRLRFRVESHATSGMLLAALTADEEQAADARQLAAARLLEARARKARGATAVLPDAVAREVASLVSVYMPARSAGMSGEVIALALECDRALRARRGRPRHRLESIERALSRPDLHDERNLRRLEKRMRVERWFERMHAAGAGLLTYDEPFPHDDSS